MAFSMASLFAGILAALAAMYGIGAVGSLALRSVRLALARERNLALLSAAFSSVILGAGVALSFLPNTDWPSPSYIPLYAGYIALCNYWANILPKKWKLGSVMKLQT
jgi:hypothetical protein